MCLRLRCCPLRRLADIFTPINAVSQIEHALQHQLRLLRILISARNICHHLLQAIRPIEQHIGAPKANPADLGKPEIMEPIPAY